MARYRFTAKRRAALRKAQKVSARKRRKGISRKKKAAVVGGVAVAAIVGYRTYNGRVEAAQKKHLEYKAWNARAKLAAEFDDDYLHASTLKPHKQPRRYRRRSSSVQSLSTIRAMRAQKYGRVGKAANLFGRGITAYNPHKVGASRRPTPFAPFKPKKTKINLSTGQIRQVQQRVGKNTYTFSYTYSPRRKKK